MDYDVIDGAVCNRLDIRVPTDTPPAVWQYSEAPLKPLVRTMQ